MMASLSAGSNFNNMDNNSNSNNNGEENDYAEDSFDEDSDEDEDEEEEGGRALSETGTYVLDKEEEEKQKVKMMITMRMMMMQMMRMMTNNYDTDGLHGDRKRSEGLLRENDVEESRWVLGWRQKVRQKGEPKALEEERLVGFSCLLGCHYFH